MGFGCGGYFGLGEDEGRVDGVLGVFGVGGVGDVVV